MAVKKKKNVEAASRFESSRVVLVLSLVVILAAAGVAARKWIFVHRPNRSLLTSLSQINLSRMEPQVRVKIQKLQEDVGRNPKSSAAWGRLAMNLEVHDLRKEAIPIYKEAAALNPSELRWAYFCALGLSQMGSEESLEWFERAVKLRPDYSPLLVNYGDALFRFGHKDRAIEEYQQATQYDPSCSHAFLGLAQISHSNGDMNDSRVKLQQALKANPTHYEANQLLVAVCRRLGDAGCVARANEASQNAPRQTPLSDPVYAELVSEGESSLWYRFRGSQYLSQGLHTEAIQAFQKALEIRSDAQTHEDLAKAFLAAGNFSKAAKHYRIAIQSHPAAENYFGLALAHARSGSFQQAEELFRKSIELKPDFAPAYFNLAVVFAKTRRPSETIASLKQAIRIDPEYAEAHYHLALTYLAIGDAEGVNEEYAILSRLDPEAAARLRTLIEEKKASNISTE